MVCSRKAFTLIELLFVVIVMALMVRVGLPKFQALTRSNMKTGATKLSGFLRSAYEQSIMRHERIRVQLDFETGKYWAEIYRDAPLIPLLDTTTKIDDAIMTFNKRLEQEETTDSTDEAGSNLDAKYEKFEENDLSVKSLPSGIKFSSVYLASRAEKRTQNTFLEFFPNGFATQSIIYIQNDYQDIYSVVLPPIGGKARVEKYEVMPDEVQ